MRTGEAFPKHLRIRRFAFSLSGSIGAHLEGSVLLFRVAELFSFDFQTIVNFADVEVISLEVGCLFEVPFVCIT